jgi:hypothetical protein
MKRRSLKRRLTIRPVLGRITNEDIDDIRAPDIEVEEISKRLIHFRGIPYVCINTCQIFNSRTHGLHMITIFL